MPSLHVCPLSCLHPTAEAVGAGHLVTLINDGTPVTRPPRILPERHLTLGINDIVAARDGMVLAAADHVRQLLGFVLAWDRQHGRDAPLLFHCWAGVSRSTAAAYIAACALAPTADEADLAFALREASPTATPNARLVALADLHLGRDGRMVAAIEAIGRGADCYEGAPFRLPIPGSTR